MEYLVESHGLLPANQAGFHHARSCMEQVVRLVEHAKKAMINNETTVATFFDIKRAFDTVWH